MGKTTTPSKIAIFFGLFLSTAGILLGSQDTNMQIDGTVTHVECGQPGTGEIEITVTGGSAPYTYSWTGPDGISQSGVSVEDFFTIDSLTVGYYEVSVSDVTLENTTDTYSIIEEDTTDPTISLKDPYTIYLNSDGSATIGWKDLDNGSSDICSETITGSLDKDTFSCAEFGSNTVTVTITDEAGNSASASTTVIVEDDRPPYAIAKDITVQLDAAGKITIEQDAVDNGSTGPCEMIFSTDITSFTCADVGDNPVVLTVTDKDGNSPSTANATVTVEDNTGPVLIFQPYTVYLDENGTVTITDADAAALSADSFDNCQIGSIRIDYEYDPYFTGDYTCEFLGMNDVPIIATDIHGNTSKDIAQVTVAENIAPVIAPVEPITATSDPASCYSSVTVPEPDVTDNCSQTEIVGTRSDGKVISDPYPIGKTTITWTATDPSGNEAEPVEQLVTVKDEENPASPALEDIYTSCTYTFTPPTTTDNCSAAENITATTEDPVTYYPQNNASSHTVLWVFEDEAGNKTEVQQTVHITPIFADFYATPVSCNGADDGMINIEATGGKEPFQYALDNNSFQNSPEFTGLAAGIYVAKVKDAYGCVVSETLEITEPDPLQLTLSEGEEETTTKAETCYGASDGEIIINGILTGGTGEYKYTVDNETFFSSPNIKGLPSGSYEVFIYDSNGCSLSGIITAYVDGPDELTASLKPVHATCFGSNTGSIEITDPAGGNAKPYHFRINNGPWREAGSSGYTFTDLEKGDYQVEMMDASGCIWFLETITITQPDELIGEITTTRTTTYGSATGTASVEADGGNGMYTYEWIDSDGNMVNDTKSASNLLAGIYELIVTDGQGCTFREYVEIIDIISADITTQSACVNEDDTIRTSYIEADPDNVLGGKGDSMTFDYEWTFGEGASLPDGTTGYGPHTVTYDTTGDKTITLKVTDNAGESITFSTNHFVGACFEECDTANNFSAHDDSFYIGDANGVRMEPGDCSNDTPMYLWFVVDKSSNGYRLFTDYVYTVKDGNTTTEKRMTNCFGKFVDGTFEDDVTGKGEVEQMTDGQLVRLNKVGTGANEIDWECDQILSIIHVTYKWSSQNKKSCEETNNNHCAATNETIKVATPIRAYAETTNTCYGENNGSIIVTASGGTGNFNYTATNTSTNVQYGPQSSNVFNSLPAGTYTVLVEDNKDMLDGQEAYFVELTGIQVEESDSALTASTEITQDILCYGGEGSAKVTAQGGTAPYTYQWNDDAQQKTAEATGLGAGTYTVTITDETGCYTNATVTLTQPDQLTTAKAGADNTSCGFNSITLQANTPTSGTGQWTIVSGPAGGSIDDSTNPKTTFTGSDGQYLLRWTISDETQNEECYSYDEVWITIIEDCYYLDFDGKDDYVDFGNNYDLSTLDPNGQGAFSIETWVKLNSTKGRKTILSKKDSKDHLNNSPGTGGYELVVSEGVVSFRWARNSLSPDSSVPLNTRRWYHIAVTYDGAEAKLFVDGIEVKSETTTIDPGDTSAPFILGATYSSVDSYTKPETHVNGWIEELRIWKKAISPEQLRFMMNQRLVNNGGVVKGHVLPMDVPGPLQWGDLAGYYRLDADEAENEDDGTTKDRATEKVHGVLKNITTKQENTAPLPYFSIRDGNWNDLTDINSPNPTPWKFGQGRWDVPNSVGINNKPINWNIVETSHNISSGNKNITLLGLLSKEGTLNIVDPNRLADFEYNRGQYLRITHYLDLDGVIDLTGESQLLQDEGSILEEESSGYIERDQQGTASSYNYNYWSSPVSLQGNPNNSGYNVKGVLRDGTDPDNPRLIDFNYQYHYADWYDEELGPKRISTFWLHIFTDKTSGTYSKWYNVRETGAIKTGEGYSMKGTSGKAAITDHQNYTFVGKPHNGTVKLQINPGNDYLIGNPYPSAIDGYKFIRDNIKSGGGTNTSNVFNGTLYFWDHFAGKTHYLQRYIGGYATLNLSGGIVAIASDARINATGDEGDKDKIPQQFIPVGQAFYVSAKLDEALYKLEAVTGGEIEFNNSQRAFETDDQEGDESNFKSREEKEAESQSSDKRQKIYLKYRSPGGLHRQLLVTRDEYTTTGFDLGYDAPLIENYDEDMYWMVQDIEFVIQGVPDLDKDRVLPLGLKVHKEGEITIAIDLLKNIPEDMEIYLRDSISDVTHDLREADFTLNLPEGTINDRFSLVFEKKLSPDEKGGGQETDGEGEEEGLQGELEFFYSRNDREITIKNPGLTTISRATIYNALGQKLMEYNSIPRESLVKLPTRKYPAGIYILRLETETGEKSTKFIVN